MNLPELLAQIRISINWIDMIVMAVITYSLLDGWHTGFLNLFSSLAAYLLAIFLAIKYNTNFSSFLREKFGLQIIWAEIAAYILIAVTVQVTVTKVLIILTRFINRYLSRSVL